MHHLTPESCREIAALIGPGCVGGEEKPRLGRRHIRALLALALHESDYTDWTDGDLADARKVAVE